MNLRPLVYFFRGLESRTRDYGGTTEQHEFAETLAVGVKTAFKRRPKRQEQVAIYVDCEESGLLNFGHANFEPLFHRIKTYLGLVGEIVSFSPGTSGDSKICGFKDLGAFPVLCAEKADIEYYVSDPSQIPPHFWDLDTNEEAPDCDHLWALQSEYVALHLHP